MSLDQRIEDGLRRRPSDERIYCEPMTALSNSRGVERVTAAPARGSTGRRSAVPALAAFCAVLALAAGALFIGVVGPWRSANVGASEPPSGSPQASASTVPSGSLLHSQPAATSSPAVQETSSVRPGMTYLQYRVQAGDYLAKIAARFNVRLWELELANPQIADPNHIEVGQVLNIPQPGQLTQPPTPTASPGGT